MKAGALVVAKAPVAGLAKTRIAMSVGDRAAADLAAASLLDTIDAVESWVEPEGRLMSITGNLTRAVRGGEIASRLWSWTVIEQRGETFAERLVAAHRDASVVWGTEATVVQIGMDTPTLTAQDLEALAAAVDRAGEIRADAALGPAIDGGWWGLATVRSGYVEGLVDVPMSRADTGDRTLEALEAAGARVQLVHALRDVDTLGDAMDVAELIPHSHFAEALVHLAGRFVR